MSAYNTIISSILKEQKSVIGPLAIELANTVEGLKVEGVNEVKIKGDPKNVIKALVKEYESLFGHASVEVCKDAVRTIKPPVEPSELPEILR